MCVCVCVCVCWGDGRPPWGVWDFVGSQCEGDPLPLRQNGGDGGGAALPGFLVAVTRPTFSVRPLPARARKETPPASSSGCVAMWELQEGRSDSSRGFDSLWAEEADSDGGTGAAFGR